VKTEAFDYDLPQELIAQKPLKVRHESRLLVYDRKTDKISHTWFKQISRFVSSGDILVVNRTRVIPARIFGKKTTGGKAEVLLLRKISEKTWEVLVGGKGLSEGKKIHFPGGLQAVIIQELSASKRIIEFNQHVEEQLNEIGHTPIPPYIHEELEDPERYQTIFARVPGSAAAPTAGLHFTESVTSDLQKKGASIEEITLHVGLDTFAPVTENRVEDHQIHSEWCEVSEITAERINRAVGQGSKIFSVGTTSARTLETAATEGGVRAYQGDTDLFIFPGYQFRVVDCLLTNFHLPRSSLLMMVSAFAGLENIMRCYREAVEKQYRFYSFGDAMLIL